VTSVPLVGNVTLVVPVVVNVSGLAPEVVNAPAVVIFPPSVTVNDPLFTPVPPDAGFKIPLRVTAPDVAVDGVNPVEPALHDITPVLFICNVPLPVVVEIPVPDASVNGTYCPPTVPTKIWPDDGAALVPVPPDVEFSVPASVIAPLVAVDGVRPDNEV
jgi:hypothetical protein